MLLAFFTVFSCNIGCLTASAATTFGAALAYLQVLSKVVSCRRLSSLSFLPFSGLSSLNRFLEASACCCLLAAEFSIAALGGFHLNSVLLITTLDLFFARPIKLFLTILAHLQKIFSLGFSPTLISHHN
jgi:hypothetical protein